MVQAPAPSSGPDLPDLPLDKLLAKARAAWPGLDARTVAFGWYADGADIVYLEGQAGFPLVRDRANQMHLDPRSGEVLWRNGTGDLPVYWIWSNMADPLHFGDFAGLWSKGVWFAFGLALSGLILARAAGPQRPHRSAPGRRSEQDRRQL